MAEKHLMTLNKGKMSKKDIEHAKAFFNPIYLIPPPEPPKPKSKPDRASEHSGFLNHPQVRPIKEDPS